MQRLLWTVTPKRIRTRLGGSQGSSRILENTGWLFVDRVLRQGFGLAIGVWLARYLGPAQLGVYSYALAFVSMFRPIAALGLDRLVVRDLVRDSSAVAETLGTAFLLRLVSGSLVVIMTMAAICVVRPGDALMRALVALTATALVLQAFDTVDLWFQSEVQSKYSVWARNLAFLLVSAAQVGLLWMRAPLVAFAAAGMAEAALGAAGLVCAYHLRGHAMKTWRASFRRASALVRESWLYMLSGLAVWVYLRVDQLMLSTFVGDDALGVYSAAVRISEAWYFIPIAFVTSLFPSIIEARMISEDLYFRRLQRLLALVALLGYVVVVPLSLLSGPLVRIVYGLGYLEAGPMLAILAWAGLFATLGVARGTWIIAEGLTMFSLATTLIGAITNVALNLVLIPRYAGLGAAVSTLVSQFVAVVLSTLFYSRSRFLFAMQVKALLLFRGVRA